MTKLEKAKAQVEQTDREQKTADRAYRAAALRASVTPEGKVRRILRRRARVAEYRSIDACDKRVKAAREEKYGETLTPWTRFKAKDSPFHPDYNS